MTNTAFSCEFISELQFLLSWHLIRLQQQEQVTDARLHKLLLFMSLLALRALFTLHTNDTNTLMHRGSSGVSALLVDTPARRLEEPGVELPAPPVYSLTDFSGRTLFSPMILRQHM